MKKADKQNLIISLIKDDLIHIKLINGLNALGLLANAYSLNLSSTIFELLGFEDNEYADEVFEYYLQRAKGVSEIDITKPNQPLDILAEEIYRELIGKI
jgi:hypothetical protein